MPTHPETARPTAPGLVWNWSDALFGVLIAIPAAITVTGDVSHGLAAAVGVIPAAVVGIPPARRRRPATALVGALAGVSILSGSVLAQVPVLAVAGIFGLAIGAAVLAGRTGFGRVVMVLALPLVGVGFSYTDVGEATGLGLVMTAGSIWATLVAFAWPERSVATASTPPLPTGMLGYGIRLGLTAATAATVGFALHLDHVGWACAAALLVMRPAAEMLELRAVGRLVAVAIGATLAGVAATIGFDATAYALAALIVVSACSATHRSRWYVTSAFTTFLALSLIVHSNPAEAGSRWIERVAETTLGVGLAYLFGIVVPELLRSTRAADPRISA